MYQVQVSWPYLSSAVLPTAIPGAVGALPVAQAGMAIMPRIDLAESQQELMYIVEMPGAKAEDIDINVDHGELVIQAELEEPALREGFVYSYQERPKGRYYRSLGLGPAVDADRIQAAFKNGILEIRIPRPSQAQGGGRRVKVAQKAAQTVAAQ